MVMKTGHMTNKERIEALLNREKIDRVPIFPFLAVSYPSAYVGASIADAYLKPEISLNAQRKAAQDFGWVFIPQLGYAAIGGWEFGGEIRFPTGEYSQSIMVVRHPVETPDDVMNIKAPDVKKAGVVPTIMAFYKLASQERLDNEPFNVMSIMGGAFTFAGNVCGPANLAKWILKKPEIVHRVMRASTDFLMELAKYWKETFGIDGVLPINLEPTASNEIISPEQFEEFALPYIRESHERVLNMGYKTILAHICGDQNANLPHWERIPMGDPGIVSVGHQIDLRTIARSFPNDVILGNLDTAVLQTGRPDEVYQAAREVIEEGKKIPAGFIFSPGCELPPKAPAENIIAMTRAVEDHGWY